MPDLIEILFWGAIILGALGEFLLPFRALQADLPRRWIANLGLGAIAIILGRWLLPLGAALAAGLSGFGLLHHLDDRILAGGVGFLLLDLVHYWLHRLSHRISLLWRLHRVHHSDLDMDFSTAFRHHPLETAVTVLVISVAVALMGIPPEAVALHQMARVVMDVASHMNVHLAPPLDRLLRSLVITPDMHRIHHSSRQPETDSNFTTFLSLWDRLFGTYVAAPALDPRAMPLGLDEWRAERALSLPRLIAQPFTNPPSAASLITGMPSDHPPQSPHL